MHAARRQCLARGKCKTRNGAQGRRAPGKAEGLTWAAGHGTRRPLELAARGRTRRGRRRHRGRGEPASRTDLRGGRHSRGRGQLRRPGEQSPPDRMSGEPVRGLSPKAPGRGGLSRVSTKPRGSLREWRSPGQAQEPDLTVPGGAVRRERHCSGRHRERLRDLAFRAPPQLDGVGASRTQPREVARSGEHHVLRSEAVAVAVDEHRLEPRLRAWTEPARLRPSVDLPLREEAPRVPCEDAELRWRMGRRNAMTGCRAEEALAHRGRPRRPEQPIQRPECQPPEVVEHIEPLRLCFEGRSTWSVGRCHAEDRREHDTRPAPPLVSGAT